MDTEILDGAFNSYIHAALWSSTDESEVPLDGTYDIDDFNKESLAIMRENFEKFFEDNYSLVTVEDIRSGLTYDIFGHDFWLTRNGHGSGFWDKGYTNGETLTSLCEGYKEVNLIIGDDGKIYGE